MKCLSPDGPGKPCREPVARSHVWPWGAEGSDTAVSLNKSHNKSLAKDLETNPALPNSQAGAEATRHTWLQGNRYAQIRSALHLLRSGFRANDAKPALSECPHSLLPVMESLKA